jgi:hypothetical protein
MCYSRAPGLVSHGVNRQYRVLMRHGVAQHQSVLVYHSVDQTVASQIQKSQRYQGKPTEHSPQGDETVGHMPFHSVAVRTFVLPPHCGGGLRHHRQSTISVSTANALRAPSELKGWFDA